MALILKDCPLCGTDCDGLDWTGWDRVHEDSLLHGQYAGHIECKECGLELMRISAKDEGDAMDMVGEAWNKRA